MTLRPDREDLTGRSLSASYLRDELVEMAGRPAKVLGGEQLEVAP